MKRLNTKILLFFTAYFLLIISMIIAVTFVDFKPSKSSLELPDTTFKQELEKHEKKIAAKQEEKRKNRWKITNETVMIAVSIGAFLDIIIAYIWVRRENRKYEGKERPKKNDGVIQRYSGILLPWGLFNPREINI